MGSRVTNNIIFRTALSDVNTARRRLAKVQEQASSGLSINKPSDDPVGVRAATLLKASLEQTEQYTNNIDRGRGRVIAVDNALSDTYEILIESKELILQASNGTLDAKSINILSPTVDSLYERLLASANTRIGGGYVFSGFDSDLQPFPAAVGPPSTFQGDINEIRIQVDDGVEIPVTLNGQRVFEGVGGSVGENLFQLITDLRNEFASATPDQDVIRAMIDRVDVAQQQISLERSRIGASETQLEAFNARMLQREEDLTLRLSSVQDADSVKVFSDLVKEENSLLASLAISARVIQPSLLQFLV